jgi:hypothetical protein
MTTYEAGTLVVDLFDNATKRVVRRGVATRTLSGEPQKTTKKINRAVAEMFEDFPSKEH